MSAIDLGFTHRYVPSQAPRFPPAGGAPTLLLLHGTGGDESDLLDLGRMLAPGAGLLSPRGKVLENGMPRFFRRLAEGVFDQEDLVRRTHELAAFVVGAAGAYGFDARQVIAVGYSNGANIAAGLLLLHPGMLAAATLFHAMVPLVPETRPDLAEMPVFLAGGRADPIVSPPGTERLAALLREYGADVTLHWSPGGHMLTQAEIASARAWLAPRLGKAIP